MACSPMNLNCFASRLICLPQAFATLEKGVEDLTTNVTGSPCWYLTLICSDRVRACRQRHSFGLVSRHATTEGRRRQSRNESAGHVTRRRERLWHAATILLGAHLELCCFAWVRLDEVWFDVLHFFVWLDCRARLGWQEDGGGVLIVVGPN